VLPLRNAARFVRWRLSFVSAKWAASENGRGIMTETYDGPIPNCGIACGPRNSIALQEHASGRILWSSPASVTCSAFRHPHGILGPSTFRLLQLSLLRKMGGDHDRNLTPLPPSCAALPVALASTGTRLRRNLWMSLTSSEVFPHFRGAQLHAAPTARPPRTKRPSASIGFGAGS
jgi:hypothetical protein